MPPETSDPLVELRDEALVRSRLAYSQSEKYCHEADIRRKKSMILGLAAGSLAVMAATNFDKKRVLRGGASAGLALLAAKKAWHHRQKMRLYKAKAVSSYSKGEAESDIADVFDSDIEYFETQTSHSTQSIN